MPYKCIPTPILQGKTPYKRFFSFNTQLLTFNSIWMFIFHLHSCPKELNLINVQPGVFFLVILMTKKEYQVYDLEFHKVFVFRDVTFFEQEFPFKNTSTTIE